jgi:hypothetical protein
LLPNVTIEAGLTGRSERADVARSAGLLRRYRCKLERFHPKLSAMVGGYFGRPPPEESAAAFFERLIANCGALANATIVLVTKFGVTFFGQYACHRVLAKS